MKALLCRPFGLAALAALLACRAAPSEDKVAPRPAALQAAPMVAPEPGPTPPPQGRPSVPPGVLSRAAAAKALERAPRCPVRPPDPGACAPSPRDDVEIEWDGAPEP